MQPSSLVFLVIIAVWAAYFVQYWVRRREHLATARSVDQFSESMRVLERRSPLPASNLSTPQPRSYSVTPARSARPQVLVKRAETSQAQVPTPPEDEGEVEPSARRTTPMVARRNRAMIMLGALSTVVVAVPLVVLSLLPLPVLLVPLVSVGGAVGWARAAAAAERRSRIAPRPARTTRSQQCSPTTAVDTVRESGAESGVVAEAGGEVEPRFEAEIAAHPVKPELFDVQAEPVGLTAPAAVAPDAVRAPVRPLVDEDDIPLTWDPVPVPRPTYTMKSRVTRPAPTSADLVGDADTEYAAYEDIPERRVAGA